MAAIDVPSALASAFYAMVNLNEAAGNSVDGLIEQMRQPRGGSTRRSSVAGSETSGLAGLNLLASRGGSPAESRRQSVNLNGNAAATRNAVGAALAAGLAGQPLTELSAAAGLPPAGPVAAQASAVGSGGAAAGSGSNQSNSNARRAAAAAAKIQALVRGRQTRKALVSAKEGEPKLVGGARRRYRGHKTRRHK